MSTSETFWFHCGRCGSLFQSQAGDQEERVCSKCGSRPDLGLEAPVALPQAATKPPPSDPIAAPHSRADRPKLGTSQNHNNKLLVKIIAGWSLVLAVIILGARILWHDDNRTPVVHHPAAPEDPGIGQEDEALLQKALPQCVDALRHYLGAAKLEEKSQFVMLPSHTIGKMARYYGSNPMERVDPAELTLSAQNILNLPDGKAVETLWNIRDSRRIEAVFRREGDSWKLDWGHFIRYSNHPWALFLAGSGEPEGEFRLLARERLAKERKDAEDISVILYAPRFGDPGETGYQSPEFNVPRKSPEGKLLDAAFRLRREGGAVYQSPLVKFDPDEMIRVRVRVRRSESEGVRSFAITRVIACHWYENDDPGVRIAVEKPEKKPAGE